MCSWCGKSHKLTNCVHFKREKKAWQDKEKGGKKTTKGSLGITTGGSSNVTGSDAKVPEESIPSPPALEADFSFENPHQTRSMHACTAEEQVDEDLSFWESKMEITSPQDGVSFRDTSTIEETLESDPEQRTTKGFVARRHLENKLENEDNKGFESSNESIVQKSNVRATDSDRQLGHTDSMGWGSIVTLPIDEGKHYFLQFLIMMLIFYFFLASVVGAIAIAFNDSSDKATPSTVFGWKFREGWDFIINCVLLGMSLQCLLHCACSSFVELLVSCPKSMHAFIRFVVCGSNAVYVFFRPVFNPLVAHVSFLVNFVLLFFAKVFVFCKRSPLKVGILFLVLFTPGCDARTYGSGVEQKTGKSFFSEQSSDARVGAGNGFASHFRHLQRWKKGICSTQRFPGDFEVAPTLFRENDFFDVFGRRKGFLGESNAFCEEPRTVSKAFMQVRGKGGKVQKGDFAVDSGAGDHFITDRKFVLPGSLSPEDVLVKVVGDGKVEVTEKGNVLLHQSKEAGLQLYDALVTEGDLNLISMSKLDKRGYRFVIDNGVMTCTNKSNGKLEFVAKLRKDGLYYVVDELPKSVFSAKAVEKGQRPYISKFSDECEVPEVHLKPIANLLRLHQKKLDRQLIVYDPFVLAGRSGRFWLNQGFGLCKHRSSSDWLSPDRPKQGVDYDFLITCPPFSLNRDFVPRLKYEKNVIVLLMNDVLSRKMFSSYDAQVLFYTERIDFFKGDGTQHGQAHQNVFHWLCKGLNLPKQVMWIDGESKFLNWEEIPQRYRKQFAAFKPDLRSLPVVDLPSVKAKGGKRSNKGVKPRHKISLRSAPTGMKLIDLMHWRCGHASEAYLRKLFDFSPDEHLSFCHACAYAKGKKHSFKSHSDKIHYFMDEVCSDLSGPHLESYFRKRYFMLCMEVESRMTFPYFLRSKSEAFGKVKEFVTMAKNKTGLYPVTFLADGGELDSQEMREFCAEKGIKFLMTAPSASDQNPFVERKIGVVKNSALAMMHNAGLPPRFWEQAVRHAVYLQNRMVHKNLQWATPIGQWDGHDNRNHFRYARIFGCQAWAFNTKAKKISRDKGLECIYLGLDPDKKSYLLYDLRHKKMVSTVHVVFDEGSFPMKSFETWENDPFLKEKGSGPLFETKESLPLPLPVPKSVSFPEKAPSEVKREPDTTPIEIDVSHVDGRPIPSDEVSSDYEVQFLDREGQSVEASATINYSDLPILESSSAPIRTESTTTESQSVPGLRRSSRVRGYSEGARQNIQQQAEGVAYAPGKGTTPALASKRLHPTDRFISERACFGVTKKQHEAMESERHMTAIDPQPFSESELAAHKLRELLEMHKHVPKDIKVPKSYKEAMESPFSELWRAACEREMEGLKSHNTFTPIKLSSAKSKPLTGRWVFDVKWQAGKVAYLKARWVVHGYKQVFGINYTETFAATAQMKTCKFLVSLAVQKGYKVTHCDISNAFVNGELDEDIYVVFPEGFPKKAGFCLKLNKSLYGLKQASRVWQLTLVAKLVELGLRRCITDTCLFVNQEHQCYVSVHVDDLLICTSDEKFRRHITSELSKAWKVKDLGQVSEYLGMNVSWHRDGSASMTQDSYIQRMADRFNVPKAKPVPTPLPPKSSLSKADSPAGPDDGEKSIGDAPYRSLIGSLLYASLGTRPDVAFAVNTLSRFNQNPGLVHWKSAMRVLRYLNGTRTMGLHFKKQPGSKLKIDIFSDSDWGSNIDDRRSISGFVVKISGGAISWSSRAQKTVALSSCEAEFLALSEALKEALWLYQVFHELDLDYDSPITIHVDNQAAINLAHNSVLHQRSKHIDIRYMRVRDEVAAGRVAVKFVPTGENRADLLTKAVSLEQFANNISDIVSSIDR